MIDVVLIIDAVAVHKSVIWDCKTKGYVCIVYYGTAILQAEDSLTKEALVFMVAGMLHDWKHPIPYVLEDYCSADV